jgi:hypothetical protein
MHILYALTLQRSITAYLKIGTIFTQNTCEFIEVIINSLLVKVDS